jgi:hypothetical protein
VHCYLLKTGCSKINIRKIQLLNTLVNKESFFRTEWFLALRAITQKPLQYFLERAEDFSEHQPNYGADENTKDDFVYDSADYKSIFNLVSKK